MAELRAGGTPRDEKRKKLLKKKKLSDRLRSLMTFFLFSR
jgi:hypothetical protein